MKIKLAIHPSKRSFSDLWIEYCNKSGIDFKIVNCYSNDILTQLKDCDGLMWHINQNSYRDNLFSKQLIFSVMLSGKEVFPDYNTVWHFDDKVGQKYLFDAIEARMPETWIFYDKQLALAWAKKESYPKVFKQRGGGGSQNVRIVKNRFVARNLIYKAFGRGFSKYYAFGSLKDRMRKFLLGRTNLLDIAEGLARFIIPPPFANLAGREKGYIYFQEFIPNNHNDIRIIILNNKAFAIRREVRKGDFRASGSGEIQYDKKYFSEETIDLAFQMADKIKSRCAAFDFIFLGDLTYVLEVSFGFIKEVYYPCTGYWDRNLLWHEGPFNPCEWMVDDLVMRIQEKRMT